GARHPATAPPKTRTRGGSPPGSADSPCAARHGRRWTWGGLAFVSLQNSFSPQRTQRAQRKTHFFSVRSVSSVVDQHVPNKLKASSSRRAASGRRSSSSS